MKYLLFVDNYVINSIEADKAFVDAWKASTPNAYYVKADTLLGVGVDWEKVGENSYVGPNGDTCIDGVFTVNNPQPPYVPPPIEEPLVEEPPVIEEPPVV